MSTATLAKPTRNQLNWLRKGLAQPGGKLPLFDRRGQEVPTSVVQACLDAGWAAPWFTNPMKPEWRVCRLTDTGRRVAEQGPVEPEEDADPVAAPETDGIDPVGSAETVEEILEILREERPELPEDPNEPRLF